MEVLILPWILGTRSIDLKGSRARIQLDLIALVRMWYTCRAWREAVAPFLGAFYLDEASFLDAVFWTRFEFKQLYRVEARLAPAITGRQHDFLAHWMWWGRDSTMSFYGCEDNVMYDTDDSEDEHGEARYHPSVWRDTPSDAEVDDIRRPQ